MIGAHRQPDQQASDGAQVVHLGEALMDQPAAGRQGRQVGAVGGQLEGVGQADQKLAVAHIEQVRP